MRAYLNVGFESKTKRDSAVTTVLLITSRLSGCHEGFSERWTQLLRALNVTRANKLASRFRGVTVRMYLNEPRPCASIRLA